MLNPIVYSGSSGGSDSRYREDLWARSNRRLSCHCSAAHFNDDRAVDSADLTLWKAGFDAAGSAIQMQGDADGDHDVDGADFLVWQRQLGSPAALGSATAVPEPLNAAPIPMGIAVRVFKRRGVCLRKAYPVP